MKILSFRKDSICTFFRMCVKAYYFNIPIITEIHELLRKCFFSSSFDINVEDEQRQNIVHWMKEVYEKCPDDDFRTLIESIMQERLEL